MALNPTGIFLAPTLMSRSWISTTPVSTWRALRRRFASANRNVNSGLTNNVIISSTTSFGAADSARTGASSNHENEAGPKEGPAGLHHVLRQSFASDALRPL